MRSYGLPDDNMSNIVGFTRLLNEEDVKFQLVIKGDQYIVQTNQELPSNARAYYDHWWKDTIPDMPVSVWGKM